MSRANAKNPLRQNDAFVVASPRLLESPARTIDQMRLINALCRFVEMAEEQATG